MDPIAAIALIWILLLFVLLILWLRARGRAKRFAKEKNLASADASTLKNWFSPALSIESEIARLREEADLTRRSTDEVRSTYAEKRKLLDQLERQVAIFDERLSFARLGIYEPHFAFSDSEEFVYEQIREAPDAAKVDALMSLCERLEAALATAASTRTHLLEALLHGALEPAAEVLEAAE